MVFLHEVLVQPVCLGHFDICKTSCVLKKAALLLLFLLTYTTVKHNETHFLTDA